MDFLKIFWDFFVQGFIDYILGILVLNWFGNLLVSSKLYFDIENILRQENKKIQKFRGNERNIIELDFSFIFINRVMVNNWMRRNLI